MFANLVRGVGGSMLGSSLLSLAGILDSQAYQGWQMRDEPALPFLLQAGGFAGGGGEGSERMLACFSQGFLAKGGLVPSFADDKLVQLLRSSHPPPRPPRGLTR